MKHVGVGDNSTSLSSHTSCCVIISLSHWRACFLAKKHADSQIFALQAGKVCLHMPFFSPTQGITIMIDYTHLM